MARDGSTRREVTLEKEVPLVEGCATEFPRTTGEVLVGRPAPSGHGVSWTIGNVQGVVRAVVTDMQGRKVRVLGPGPDQLKPPAIEWDGCDDAGREAGSGVYLLILELSDGRRLTGRAVVLR